MKKLRTICMAVATAFAAISKGANGLKCAMVGKNVLLAGEISDAVKACGAKIDAYLSHRYLFGKEEDCCTRKEGPTVGGPMIP